MNSAAAMKASQLASTSAELIASLQDPSGAYPASPTFSAYQGYSWFRDGAFIADAMSAVGRDDSAEHFFAWCASVVLTRRDRIESIVSAARQGAPLSDDAMLATRFRFDGSEGSDDWWDFQLDGYGTWAWAVAEHRKRGGAADATVDEALVLTVDYLVATWDRPCFDWWEEHTEQRHVSTLGCVAVGLESAIALGVLDQDRATRARATASDIRALVDAEGMANGHLTKWLGTDAVDASLAALVGLMGYLPPTDPRAKATLDKVEADLVVNLGTHRFVADTFFGGGQWPLLSCFVGIAHARMGDTAKASAYLEWAVSTATVEGHLPEQVAHHLLAPERRQEWIDRWGTAATPLLWSHAMFLRLNAEVTP